jgi:MFS transporter, DHA1 family, multidrug resistance protein
VFATLPFTYLAVSTLAVLIVLRFVHGLATAIFGPVASASLSDIAPPTKRGAWLSTYSTAQGTGQAIGPIVAGYLIAAGRYDLAFAAAGLIGVGVPFHGGTLALDISGGGACAVAGLQVRCGRDRA